MQEKAQEFVEQGAEMYKKIVISTVSDEEGNGSLDSVGCLDNWR